MGAWSSPYRAWPALIASLLVTPPAAAASRYRLELVRAEGAGSCPSAAAVEREVSARLGRNPFSRASDRGIEVVLERTEPSTMLPPTSSAPLPSTAQPAQGWRARLFLRLDPSEPDQVRLIESDAADCAELAKSVTLAISLAIAPELPPVAEPEPPPAPPCPPPPPPPPRERAVFGAVSGRALLAPELLPGTSAGAALSVTVRGDLLGATFGGLFFPENELSAPAARVRFGLSAAFAAGCLWARTSDPQVWGCLGSRVGALHAVVFTPQPQEPGQRLWAAATSELGLRQHLHSRLFVEGGVAAVFPLIRHRFQIDAGSAPIYEQPTALVEGFLGLGLELD